MTNRVFSFVAANSGTWTVIAQKAVSGDPLPQCSHLSVNAGDAHAQNATWTLRGIVSNERYVEKTERAQLVAKQEGLNRREATSAALIPIRKRAEWWALTQDERRRIFEDQSKHIQVGLKYLPAIARRLHHCRDLSEREPFDFLTWFEYSPVHRSAFEDLLGELRDSPEWAFVEREVDLRLERL